MNPPDERLRAGRRTSRGALAAVATIIAVVAVILGLGFANVIPGFHLAPSGEPSGRAYGPPPFPKPSAYNITFTETGLPAATAWSVTLGGSTQSSPTATITFSEANGSYAYTVPSETGYTVAPASGTLSVHGAAVSQAITFSPVSPTTPTYNVTFTENGLPGGTAWSVAFGGATTSSASISIAFREANGTYVFTVGTVAGYSPTPSSGTLTVTGVAVSKSITFTQTPPSTYSVTFSETGLPSGTSWTVAFQGTPNSATAPNSIVVSGIADGSYTFTASAPGYSGTPASGPIVVNGAAVTQSIVFHIVTVSGAESVVTFHEKGLPAGSLWGVLVGVNGTAFFVQENDGNTTSFALPNGTYRWGTNLGGAELVPSGYDVSPGAGPLTVNGRAIALTLTFSPVTPTSSTHTVNFTELGLPSGHLWNVMFNGALARVTVTSTQFSERNGTYNYSLTSVGYDANLTSGTVIVDGSSVVVKIDFVAAYSVTFSESGLPNTGASWTVALNGSISSATTGSSIVFPMPVGTYYYTVGLFENYSSHPSTGSVRVSPAGASVSVAFTLSPHSVTFSESGLPSGYVWDVYILPSAVTIVSNGNLSGLPVYFSLPNGNYSYELISFPYPSLNGSGYIGDPVTGFFQVNGSSVAQSVKFVTSSGRGFVVFSEISAYLPSAGGFPQGLSWSVTLGGDTVTTQGWIISFEVPNGTYSYTITPPAGYVVAPSSGNLTIDYVIGSFYTIGAGLDLYFAPAGTTNLGPSLPQAGDSGGPALVVAHAAPRPGTPTGWLGMGLLVRRPNT